MISSVSLLNFKGHNRRFALGRATMIVGENFKGKTGLFQGIALGVHGSLPHPSDSGKKLEPYGLASGNPMEVQLTCDNLLITRRWEKDRKGSVRYSGYDGEPLVPSVMLDARTYFDLSADKRMRYVFGAVKLEDGDFSANKLIADLKNLKIDPMTEEHQAALTQVVLKVTESWTKFEAERESGLDLTIQDWLGHVVTTLKEDAKLSKQAVDRMVKTVAGITELQLRDTAELDANTATLENRLQTIRQQIGEKQTALGSLRTQLSNANTANKQRATLLDERAKLPAPRKEEIEREAEVSAMRDQLQAEERGLITALANKEAELSRLGRELERIKNATATLSTIDADLAAIPDQSEEIAKATAEIETRKNATRNAQLAHTSRKQDYDVICQSVKMMIADQARDQKRRDDVAKQLTDLDSMTECPFCATHGDAFHAAARAHFQRELDNLDALLKRWNEQIDVREAERTAAAEAAGNCSVHVRTCQDAELAEQMRLDQLSKMQQRRDLLLARRAEASKALMGQTEESLNSSIAEVKQRHGQDESLLTLTKTSLTSHNTSLHTITMMKRAQVLDESLANAPAVDVAEIQNSITQCEGDVAGLQSEFNQIDGEIRRNLAAKNDALRQNQAVEERDKAKAEQDMTKLAVAAVTDFQQKMVDKAFETIIKDANRFCEGILESPLVYREGNIGRIRNGVFASHDYLSGTEQALCFAGISVALAMQSPFRLVMIDEMTRLSDTNKELTIDRMITLQRSGIIDQFIGVDCDLKPSDKGAARVIPDCYRRDDLTVIHFR